MELNEPLAGSCAAEKLVWGEDAAPGAFDLVVGADLLYESSQYAALAQTLADAAPADAVLAYLRRVRGEDRFLDRVGADFDVELSPLALAAGARDGVVAHLWRR